MNTMSKARGLGGWLSLVAMAWATPWAWAESAPYGYDLRVKVLSGEEKQPRMEMRFDIGPVEHDRLITPRLRVSGLRACPGKAFTERLSMTGTVWKDAFEVECRGLIRREKGRGSGWRLRLVDAEGRPVEASVSEVTLKLGPATRPGGWAGPWRLRGRFLASSFALQVVGHSVDEVLWRLDTGSPTLGSHMMVAVVRPVSGGAGVSPHPDVVDVAASESVAAASPEEPIAVSSAGTHDSVLEAPAPPEAAAGTDSADAAKSDSSRAGASGSSPAETRAAAPELHSLTLNLKGSRAPRDWPPASVWLSAPERGPFRAVPLPPGGRRGRDLTVDLPEDLVGRDVLVQVMAWTEDGVEILPIALPGGGWVGRLRIAGSGNRDRRLHLEWPRSWRHRLEVRVTGPRGKPIEGATVALQWVQRQERIVEQTSGASAADGRVRLGLEGRKDGPLREQTLWILCAKTGWTGQVTIVHDPFPPTVDCRLSPVAPPTGAAAVHISPPVRGWVVDEVGGGLLSGAEVTVRWPGEPGAQVARNAGGVFAAPTPLPLPAAAQFDVRARCYEPFSKSLRLPLEAPIRLRHRCRSVGLSLRLVRRGDAAPVEGAGQAVASVHQSGELRVDGIGFDDAGFSEIKDFLYDPSGGPVEVRVTAPGWRTASHRIEQLGDSLSDSDIASDLTIALQPAGRGVAVLLNAAERWALYPQARDAVVEVLHSLDDADRPSQLAFGVLSGDIRRLEPGAWDRGGALGEQLGWLRGLSAVGGQLLPAQLESKLGALDSLWPRAGAWDLILVIPHNELAGGLETEELARLRGELQKNQVALHVLEDGGGHAIYSELASALGGVHMPLLAHSPAEKIDALKEKLRQIFAAAGGGEHDRD